MDKPLIPVFPASANEVDGPQLCNARDLHAFMQVSTRFDDWMRRRIEEYGFVEGEDFSTVSGKTSGKGYSSNLRKTPDRSKGGRPTIDYHLTLDMAKELAMIENNEVGRKVRRYFIRAEAELRERLLADLRDRARHVLDLPGIKRFRHGISFKQTVILQQQSRDIMGLILIEPSPPARLNLHRQLRQVNDALGIPTDPLAEICSVERLAGVEV